MSRMENGNSAMHEYPDKKTETAGRREENMEPGDYIGEGGLIYCGVCHEPKQKRFEDSGIFAGQVHHVMCRCERERHAKEEARQRAEEKARHVDELRRDGFLSRTMWDWTFAGDNGQNPQMAAAKRYAANWEQMKEKNIGLLLWGDVGCGKSYLAGAIANALIDQEIAVRMTNFSAIINDLSGTFEGRNQYLDKLCSYPLLIIDDFGMERGTEYGLEQVYSVIDGRYRSGKPLIVTTNLTLTEMRNAVDTAHKRIYDRVLDMCVPILCKGDSFRKKTAEEKLEAAKNMLYGNKEGR